MYKNSVKPLWLKILVLLACFSLTILSLNSFLGNGLEFGFFWLVMGILLSGEIIEWKKTPQWLNVFHSLLAFFELGLFLFILFKKF